MKNRLFTKDYFGERLQDLIHEYNDLVLQNKLDEYTEADVGSKFILPLLEALGWDIRNIDEVKEQKRAISGPVDYCISANKKMSILIEIKSFTVSGGLDGYYLVRGRKETFPEQAMRYGWHLKVNWIILTDFKEIRLYNTYAKEPEQGLTLKFKLHEYLNNVDQLWRLSKNEVVNGSLNRLEVAKERKDIDEEILDDLFYIRGQLATNIHRNNVNHDPITLRENVQKIMDRLLVIRVAEDREIIGFDSLHKTLELWKSTDLASPFMINLRQLFRGFDTVYNTKLFEEHISENLKIDDDVLEHIIDVLYKYNFYLISSDVLGAIYEHYVGYILVEDSNEIEILESSNRRREGGIFYTPVNIVDYIVARTLGAKLNEKIDPEKVQSIKILDPACGSGSFLIRAYNTISKWYQNYYKETGPLFNESEDHMVILNNNLYGVDLDPQAAEIASVNLMLQAIRKNKKLPQILGQKIKIGNTLISGSENELGAFFGEGWSDLRSFNWKQEYPEVFQNGGFDIIIGNPPYEVLIRSETRPGLIDYLKKGKIDTGLFHNPAAKNGYISAEYNPNLFVLFIERCLNLLKDGGILGFIIQNTLYTNIYFKNIRKLILDSCKVLEIDDLRYSVFSDAVVDSSILILQKESDSNKRNLNKVKVILNIQDIDDHSNFGDVIIFDQSFFYDPERDYRFSIFLQPKVKVVIDKVDKFPDKLGKYVKVNRGVGLVSPDDEAKATLFTLTKSTSHNKPVFVGKDVSRYVTRWSEHWAKIDDTTIAGGTRDPIVHEFPEKIIFPRIRNLKYKERILASFDDRKIWVLDNYNILRVLSKEIDSKFILALLNSKVLNFYFRNVFVDVNIKGTFIEKLPIPEINLDNTLFKSLYDSIITCSTNLLDQYSQLFDINLHFSDYLKEPILQHKTLRSIYDTLELDDKKPLDLENQGKITDLSVIENHEWLSFQVDWIAKDDSIKTNHEILRIRINDEELRKFIAGYINENKGSFINYNLLNQILDRRLPRFAEDNKENLKLIKKQMKPYVLAKHKYSELLDSAIADQEKLDKLVYQLYNLDKNDVDLIEEDSRLKISDPVPIKGT